MLNKSKNIIIEPGASLTYSQPSLSLCFSDFAVLVGGLYNVQVICLLGRKNTIDKSVSILSDLFSSQQNNLFYKKNLNWMGCHCHDLSYIFCPLTFTEPWPAHGFEDLFRVTERYKF